MREANRNPSLLNNVILHKSQSSSSIHRMATVSRSADIFTSTCGLGAGLGSNRAMSLIAYILSNLGAVGAILFAWLLISLRTIARRAMSVEPQDAPARMFLRALGWAFSAHLLAMSESAAEINDPSLWILWAIMIALIRQEWLIAHPATCVPARVLMLQAY